MPVSSLVKFANRVDHSSGKKLWWGRADVDGLPFRGAYAPIMPEEEYEARVVRIADARNGFFDVRNQAQNKAFLDVLECCFNGWFQMVFIERFWNSSTSHYLEWVEYYLEDGTRTPFASNGIMELANGHANPHGHPGGG